MQKNNRTIITVDHLVKRYKKATENAVDDVSFQVKEGEFFALLGPNGAGKTTIISILTTTLSKTNGEITVAGYDLEKDSAKVRQSIGVIFQNPSLDLNLSAEENIRFHALLYGLYPYRPMFRLMDEKYKKRVLELAEVIGLDKEIFKQVKTFSGGMKRKLEIIRSLMHKPRILYLDEPTSGLDPASRKNLWQYLDEIRRKEKTTMFLTTHYLEEAEDAETVVIINKGKIVAEGSPEKIKRQLIDDYLIIDSEKRKILTGELEKLGIPYKEDDRIHIDVDIKKAQQIIKQIETPLSYFEMHKPSLEEAYLEIIGGEKSK